jgi:hypothetical protein
MTRPLLALVAVAAAALLPATAQAAVPASVAGTYSVRFVKADTAKGLPATFVGRCVALVVARDGRYAFGICGTSSALVKGSGATVSGTTMTFGGAETGPLACGKVRGSYKLGKRGSGLGFTAVKDACAGRKLFLTLHPWAKRA